MLRRFAATILISLAFVAAAAAPARAQQGVSVVVMILPFENTSGLKDFNWVGESFSDQLADLLGSHGLRVVSSDARDIAYQRLRVPVSVIPSRATSISRSGYVAMAVSTVVLRSRISRSCRDVRPAPTGTTIAPSRSAP